MAFFPSFESTVTPFIPRMWPTNLKMLVHPITGAPVGIQNMSATGPDGLWTPVDLTAAQIASPTPEMIADLNSTFRLNEAPWTRYQSNGTALVLSTAGGFFLPLTGGAVSGATTFSAGLTGTLTGHASLDLPLTGGTVTGLATLSGVGTALAVTNDATVGGALTVAGTVSGAGFTALLSPYASTSAMTTAIGVETTRATTAEGLLAPRASPTFTGTLTAAIGILTGALSITAASTGLAVTNNATIGGTLGVTGVLTATGGVVGALTGHASLDLALTGGTVSGATTFSAASTALAVTNNATIGGTLGTTGLTSASGGIKVGTGTLHGEPYTFQTAINADPSAGVAVNRQTMFNTTLTYSTTTTNIWEGLTQFTEVNGPGTATGEINGIHSYMLFNAGSIINAYENFEASTTNNGTLSDGSTFLSLFTNGAAGTVTTALNGMKFQLINGNAGAGSIASYAAIDMEAMTGAGTAPTNFWIMRCAEARACISTLGGINLGSLATLAAGIKLNITGTDNSAGTFPIQARNLAGTVILLGANDGKVFFGNAASSVDVSGAFSAVVYKIGATQVVGARDTGWSAMTGTANKVTVYDTSTVTLPQLAARMLSLQAALTTHGLIGT